MRRSSKLRRMSGNSAAERVAQRGGVALLLRGARVVILIGGGLSLLAPPAEAQGPLRCLGLQKGQLDGPYCLQSEINPGEPACTQTGGSLPAPRYAEIAHAVALPPPNNGYVLLWCARSCFNLSTPISSATIPPYEMFLWHTETLSVTRLPQYSLGEVPPGTADLFCGGQGLDRFGNPVIWGGTNVLAGCTLASPTIAYGHNRVALFQNVSSLRQWWINPVPPGEQAEMTRSRWYATWVRLPNGDILIAGHEGYPHSEGYPATVRTRERGRTVDEVGVADWFDFEATNKNFRNWRYDAPEAMVGPCEKVDDEFDGYVAIPNYTHMHVTLAGQVVALVARTGVASENISTTAYLDFNICPFPLDPDDERERWIPEIPEPAVLPSDDGAPSLHIVDLTIPAAPSEVIYSLGGGTDETSCTNATNQVVRLSNPAPGVPWLIDQPMIHKRNSCNALLGLDGAIYVIGGVDLSCMPVLEIERLRPPEVFQASMVTGWMLMCALREARAYHSWAVLLQDGTMAIGGGTVPEVIGVGPNPSNHSVEVYRPPYMYEPQAPAIVDWPDEMPVLQPGGTYEVFANLQGLGTGGEFRVALLAPSAVTHTVNNDQRYVMLRVFPTSTDPGTGVTTIPVQVPTNVQAPAGVYMLTVVNSAGTPSRSVFNPEGELIGGAWLRLEPEL